MDFLLEAICKAFGLIFSIDREVFTCVLISLEVSSIAILFSILLGLPIGLGLATKEFRGKRIIVMLINTSLAFPTVVIGLFVYAIICRQGPFGTLGLLFTPVAMIIGEVILATPIVAAFSFTAIQKQDKRIKDTALTLGANRFQVAKTIMFEARFAIIAAVIAGFGRLIGEVGVSMMLGGNIKGTTRNITTAIALEVSKGEFAFGMALGIILLIVAFGINILFQYLQGRGK